VKFDEIEKYRGGGKLFVVSGPSGAGKSTVLQGLLQDPETGPTLEFSVSSTTRRPRPGEEDGVHYHFISHGEFEKMKDEGSFLEWEKVHDSYYGTPASNLDAAFGKGKDLVLEIDVKGAANIKRKHPGAVLIFIVAPEEELRKRLVERPENMTPRELEEEIELRMNTAREEISHISEYDYLLVNENLDECVKYAICIIRAERCRMVDSGRHPGAQR